MPRLQPPVVKLKTALEIAFSPAEDRLAFFGGRDVRVLRLPAFKSVFAVHPIAHPSHIDFSPDGRRLVVKSTSGRTVVLDAQTGRTLRDFRNQKEKEGSVALFSSCGRYVVSVSWGGLLSVRDSATGELVFSRVRKDCFLNDLSVPQDRRFFVYSVGHGAPSDSQPPPPAAVVLHSWPIRNGDCRECLIAGHLLVPCRSVHRANCWVSYMVRRRRPSRFMTSSIPGSSLAEQCASAAPVAPSVGRLMRSFSPLTVTSAVWCWRCRTSP